MSYSQQQFQQHMGQLRTYSYMKGKNREFSWLWDKNAEQRLTEALEKDFVNDFDTHLEEFANNLSNEDFKKTLEYWMPLAQKHWNGDQRNLFFEKIKRLKSKYTEQRVRESQDNVFTRTIALCDEILIHKEELSAARPRPSGFRRSVAFVLGIPISICAAESYVLLFNSFHHDGWGVILFAIMITVLLTRFAYGLLKFSFTGKWLKQL